MNTRFSTERRPVCLFVRTLRIMPWLILGLAPVSVMGQEEINDEQMQFFEKHIRPALNQYCYECHSVKTGRTNGGLLVDSREGLLQGGDSGPAVEPNDIESSVLWGAITWSDYEMPPKRKMPSSVIAKFKEWIEMGAPDPRVREKIVVQSTIDVEAGKSHWAFQAPVGSASDRIDDFVDAEHRKAGVSAAKPAGATTILRRLNFDLIGLPPAPEEVTEFYEAWKRDPRSAIRDKVDDLLSRDQYGERWGRHWMDVARYAESSGKETNFTFPHAWRYRDYVINAFNQDKPYDEFIREQVAGDLLPYGSTEEQQEHLIATGFLAMGAKSLNERNPRQFRMDVVDEQIDTLTQAVLGVTVACARCHDHKFDPIPTADYYAMAGIFLSTDPLYGTANGQQNRRATDLIDLPIPDRKPLTKVYSPEEIVGMRSRMRELQDRGREMRRSARRDRKPVNQREALQLRNQVARLDGIIKTLDRDGAPRTVAMGVSRSPSSNGCTGSVTG